jgi:hypothetical protein
MPRVGVDKQAGTEDARKKAWIKGGGLGSSGSAGSEGLWKSEEKCIKTGDNL